MKIIHNKVAQITFLVLIILGVLISLLPLIRSPQTYVETEVVTIENSDDLFDGDKFILSEDRNYRYVEDRHGYLRLTLYAIQDYSENNTSANYVGKYDLVWNWLVVNWSVLEKEYILIENSEIDDFRVIENIGNDSINQTVIEPNQNLDDKTIDESYIRSIQSTYNLSREEAVDFINRERGSEFTPLTEEELELKIQETMESFKKIDAIDQRMSRESAIGIVMRFEEVSEAEAALIVDETINADGEITEQELQELAASYTN